MESNETTSEYNTPFKFIADHFEKRGLNTLSIDWEKKSLFFQMFERQVVMGCSFFVSEDDHMLQIVLRYPIIVADPKMRPSVAELVTRANYGLRVGSFELDMKDGELRYHITHLMENLSIGENLLMRLFNTGMSTTDRYFSAYMQSLYSGVTPEDAVYMAELDMHADQVEEKPATEVQPPALEEKKQSKKRSPKKKPKADAHGTTHLLLEESSDPNLGVQNSETTTPEGKTGEGGEDESRHGA